MCKLQIYLDKTADSFCGTPDYMAPEIIKVTISYSLTINTKSCTKKFEKYIKKFFKFEKYILEFVLEKIPYVYSLYYIKLI